MYSKAQMEKYQREGFLKEKEVAGWKDIAALHSISQNTQGQSHFHGDMKDI